MWLFFSFLIGLVIDIFSNTPGMHAFACTLAGFIRHPLIQLLMGKDLPEGINPSYQNVRIWRFLPLHAVVCRDSSCGVVFN